MFMRLFVYSECVCMINVHSIVSFILAALSRVCSREIWPTAPPCLCVNAAGPRDTARLTIARHTNRDLIHVRCPPTLRGAFKRRGRTSFCLRQPPALPAEASGDECARPANPEQGETRPASVAGFPVRLRRPALSPEPGASAGLFLFTHAEAAEL